MLAICRMVKNYNDNCKTIDLKIIIVNLRFNSLTVLRFNNSSNIHRHYQDADFNISGIIEDFPRNIR